MVVTVNKPNKLYAQFKHLSNAEKCKNVILAQYYHVKLCVCM